MEIKILLDQIGEFTWFFGDKFFIETSMGNFLWSDPDYNGDNTISSFNGSYKDACKHLRVPFGRDKGTKKIREYCGDQIKLGSEINPKQEK
jgi:hypothetical protein